MNRWTELQRRNIINMKWSLGGGNSHYQISLTTWRVLEETKSILLTEILRTTFAEFTDTRQWVYNTLLWQPSNTTRSKCGFNCRCNIHQKFKCMYLKFNFWVNFSMRCKLFLWSQIETLFIYVEHIFFYFSLTWSMALYQLSWNNVKRKSNFPGHFERDDV